MEFTLNFMEDKNSRIHKIERLKLYFILNFNLKD